MKTYLNICRIASVTLMLLISALAGNSQDRGSVWVHGLNSSSNDWLRYEALFKTERKLFNQAIGNRPAQYFNRNGVKSSAAQVFNTYRNQTINDNRSIYIGHSNGGVVGRELDVNPAYANTMNGFITFGSPMDGARIADAVVNGEADYFIANGVNQILEGPSRQGFVLILEIFGIDLYNVINTVIRNATQGVLSPQNSSTDQGLQDLREGSTYLNSGVRNIATSSPKIHVYGNENSPVIWRYLGSYYNLTNGSPIYNDEDFVGFANLAGDAYDVMMWTNIALAAETAWYTFGISAIYFGWVADGWAQGRDWVRYDSENGWNGMIGANSPAYYTVTYSTFDYNRYYQCMYNSGGYGSYYYTDRYTMCANQATSYTTYYYYSPVNGQSDAFIKAPSQTGYNSVWSGNAIKVEALGVNHIEMLDHPTVTVIFRRIFDGGVAGADFFRTDRR